MIDLKFQNLVNGIAKRKYCYAFYTEHIYLVLLIMNGVIDGLHLSKGSLKLNQQATYILIYDLELSHIINCYYTLSLLHIPYSNIS